MKLRDDVFLRPKAPESHSITIDDLAALRGLGDRRARSDDPLLRTIVGYEADQPVEWTHPAGHTETGRVVEVLPSGKVAKVETLSGDFVAMPISLLRRQTTETKTAQIREALHGSVREAFHETSGLIPIGAGRDFAMTLAYPAGQVPTDDEVRRYVARRYPAARVLDADASQPGRLGVVLAFDEAPSVKNRSPGLVSEPMPAADDGAYGDGLDATAETLERMAKHAAHYGCDVVEESFDTQPGRVVSHYALKRDGETLFVTPSGELSTVIRADSLPATGRVIADAQGIHIEANYETGNGPLGIHEDEPGSYETGSYAVHHKGETGDACAACNDADEVSAEHLGGPGLEIEAADKATKDYWRKYYKEYGRRLTEDVKRKKHKREAIVAAWKAAGRKPSAGVVLQVLTLLERTAQAEFETDLGSLATELARVKTSTPEAAKAIDKLVIDYLARSPESLDRLNVFDRALNEAVDYWSRMEPAKLESVRNKYAPAESPISTETQPGWGQRLLEKVSPQQRIKREMETGAVPGLGMPKTPATPTPTSAPNAPETAAPAAPAPQTAPPRQPGYEKLTQDLTLGQPLAASWKQGQQVIIEAGTPVKREKGGGKLKSATGGRILKVEDDGVLVLDNRNDFIFVTDPRGLKAARRVATHGQPAKAAHAFNFADVRRQGDYVVASVVWDPDSTESMSAKNVEHQIISFVKERSSKKERMDLGNIGRVRVRKLDVHSGIAEVIFRSTEARAFPPEQITVDEGTMDA